MNCKGIFGRLFGHNYTPVFNRIPPNEDFLADVKGTTEGITALLDGMSRKEHIHTICTRCGDVIEARLP